MLSSAISRAHEPSSSFNTRRTSAKSRPASGRGNAIVTSCSIGAASSPAADSTPGWRGISTLPMPSSVASAVAWIGPAPPSATSVKRRGSQSATDRHQANALDHLRIHHAMDAKRRVFHRQTERSRDAPLDRRARQRRIQRHRSASEICRIEPAKHDRCIGHRGFLAAASIAGRTRFGSCGMRTDAQAACAVEPGDGPAARANRVHIDHRHAHRKSRDGALRANHRLAAFHQRDVARCAADIDGDQVAIPRRAPNDGTADHAGRGTREEQPHRTLAARPRCPQGRRATA